MPVSELVSSSKADANKGAWSQWHRRKFLWDQIFIGLFRGISSPPLPLPNDDKVKVVPWQQAHGQPVALTTGWPIPRDEYSRLKNFAKNIVVLIRDAIPPITGKAPALPMDDQALLREVWTAGHQRVFPNPPRFPSTFKDGLDLGKLMVEGPFAEYVRRGDDGVYRLDLTELDNYPHHPGTRKLGSLTEFAVDTETRSLRTVSIHHPSSGQTYRPGDAGWDQAQVLVTCGVFADASYIQHLIRLHLLSSGYFSCSVRNHLSAKHPLKALLWPHVYGVLDVNNTLGGTLICEPRGVFGDFTNITHSGLWSWANDYATKSFRLESFDPQVSMRMRGVDNAPFDQPTMDDTSAIWRIVQQYARDWVDCYYASDAAVAADTQVRAFLENLDATIANGIRAIVPNPAQATREQLAYLCAIHIQGATVLHHIYGSMMWNYAPWARMIPPRVYEDGGMPAADVYQRMLNALFVTNVPNRKLMEDASAVAPNAAGAAVMRQFVQRLEERQTQMDQQARNDWRVYPKNLDASIAV